MASTAALDLIVNLKGQASQGLETIGGSLGGLKSTVNSVAGAFSSLSTGSIGGALDSLSSLPGPLGVAAGALSGVGAAFDSLTSAASAEKLENDRLLQSIKNNDAAFNGSAETLNTLIAAGEAKAFADSEVRDSLAKLTSATGDVTKAANLQQIAFDVARSKGISLEAATNALSKAQMGSLGGLEKLGVAIDKNSTLQGAMDELQRESAGAADLYASSAEGAGIRSAAAWQNAQEDIGAALLPIKEGIQGAITGVLTSPEFQGAIQLGTELIGTTLTGAMNILGGAIDFVKPIIEGIATTIGGWFTSMAGGGDIMQPITDAATALSDVLSGALSGAVTTLQGMWDSVWPAISAAVLPVLVTVFSELSKFWIEIQPKLQEVFNNIQSVVQTVWPIIQGVLEAGMKFITDLWNNVWPGLSQVLSGVWEVIQGVVTVAWGVVSGIINAGLALLSGDWQGAWDAIQAALGTVWAGIQQIISGAWAIVEGVINVGLGYLKTIWDTAWNAISGTVTDIWNGITTWVGDQIESVRSKIEIGILAAQIIWNNIWDTISTKVTEIWTSITTGVQTAIDSVKSTIDTVTGTITSAWSSFWDGVGTKAKEIWDSIVLAVGMQIASVQSTIDTVTSTIKSTWDGFWDGIGTTLSTAWTTIVSTVTGKIDEIKTMLGNVPGQILSTVTSIGTSIIDGIIAGIQGAWNNITTTIGNLAKDLPQPIKDALGIHSPSNEMADQIGDPIAQGVLVGMQNAWPGIISGAVSLMGALVETFRAGIATFAPGGEIYQLWYNAWRYDAEGSGPYLMIEGLSQAFNASNNFHAKLKYEVFPATFFAEIGAGFAQSMTWAETWATAMTIIGTAATTTGSAISSGMAAGITAGKSSVISAAVDVATSALAAAKQALGIASPSKAFAYLGEMSGAGFAAGLKNSESMIQRTITDSLAMPAVGSVASQTSVGRSSGSTSSLATRIAEGTTVFQPGAVVINIQSADDGKSLLRALRASGVPF